MDKTSGGSVTRTVTYYPAGGAMRINTTGGSNTLYYILKDHLGSASVVTDSTGAVVGEQRYYPFGETRLSTGTIFTDKLFTGQQEMAGLGIYNYGARFYSPKLGRFLSADSIVSNLAAPEDLNRFSYVRNNPLRYTDPTGHVLPCEQGDTCIHITTTTNNGSDLGLIFDGNGGDGDKDAFIAAAQREADAMFASFCSYQFDECGFSSAEDLYLATHGTTIIEFYTSSLDDFCQRNYDTTNIICGSNSNGLITSIIAAHELGHVFNEIINSNGSPLDDPWHDLANAQAPIDDTFPDIGVGIASGYSSNSANNPSEDFANTHSMWVLGGWDGSEANSMREEFMNDNMSTWIYQMLVP